MTRTLAVVSALPLLLTGCAQKPPSNITINGHLYHSSSDAIAGDNSQEQIQLAEITPATDRIGGRVLVILPDADRIRPTIFDNTGKTPPANAIDVAVQIDLISNQAVADAMKRSNLFDSVETITRNDTENPTDTGYDYILWKKVTTTLPNHAGKWVTHWALKRGTNPAEQSPKFDPGVPEKDRLVSFVRSVREAAAKLGGPSVPGVAGGTIPSGSLSGIAINARGDVVTSDHGVRSCGSITIRAGAATLPAQLVAQDQANDLALLHADHGFAAPLALREGAGIRPGDPVTVLGYPYGEQYASAVTTTTGSVSSLTGPRDDTRILQFTAPIQPGNSGGPVLDSSGHVVGVTAASLNGVVLGLITGALPQNTNFAVKAGVVREFLDTNGVKYRTAPAGAELKPADITEQAKQSVVYVQCLK